MKLKSFAIALLGLGLSIVVLELGLRLIFGFGNPPLSQADDKTGYRFQPNQKLFRFGKYIEINQYSQRNPPISALKPPNTRRILMIGDSVLNGGVQTDQADTVTERFRDRLGESIEVLNASAGSWGIENRIGYLREFGAFQSDVIIFQIGSSDLIQRTSTGNVVGRDPSFPNQRPWSAIGELWSRYLSRRLVRRALIPPAYAEARSPEDKAAWFARNRQSFSNEVRSLRTTPETKNIPIIVLYTPYQNEVLPTPQPPLYKAEFFALLKQLKIPVVDVHQAWSSIPVEQKSEYFADEIHLSETGNQAVADLLVQQLCIQAKSTWCKP
ncbi:SGNH/GDSL hydrolase family protein [Pseudanabaenaceae cyanobacterium LEGE 13415]|nr:SGNH/GDSL hydrolase family protein [Pseudanabaenaceae cyanobacterium LEGE 13415]